MELHTVPGFNQTQEDGYTFQDDGASVEVRVSLPAALRASSSGQQLKARDVSISTAESGVKVEVRGQPAPLLDCEELWATIRPNETTWTLDREAGEIVVHLQKHDENEPWGSLTKQGKQNEAAKAFAQMEKIKKLFESTERGTPEDFDLLLQDIVDDPSMNGGKGGDADESYAVDQVRDGNQKNSLHFAAQQGNLALCRHLVEAHKVPVDSQDVEGETPLSLSAASAKTEVVHFLLDCGANPNVVSSSSSLPIHRCCLVGDVDSLRKMVACGAHVNAPSDMGTPLHCAAGCGNAECVQFLLSQPGVDMETQDESGVSPLMASVAYGKEEIVNLLLEAGADPNSGAGNGATAMHIAASMDSVSMLDALVRKGASADCVDKDNLKPIHAAAVCEARKALKRLLAITKRIPGVEWTVQGMIDDAVANDGYVKDFTIEEIGGDGEGSEEGASSKMRQAEIEIKVVDADRALELKSEGDAHFKKASFGEAIRLYTASIEQDNSNSAAFANRAAAQIQLKNFAAALEDAVVARTLKPDYMKAYYREGMAHQELGHWEEAAQAYFEGCRIENENDELIKRFQHAMKMAKEEHKSKAEAGASSS